MTTASYNRLKKALVAQRRKVTASPAAATRFLKESGLKDVVTGVELAPIREKAIPKKAAPKKK